MTSSEVQRSITMETAEHGSLIMRHSKLIMWVTLALALYIATFGIVGAISMLVYLVLVICGFFIVLANWSVNKSKEVLASDDVPLLSYEEPYCGLPAVFKRIEAAPQNYKYDKRLSGSSCIDEVIQEVLHYFFRDYIDYWYYSISDHERFRYELRQTIQRAIILFATRTKEVEWVPFLTTRLVDDFAIHMKIFRITNERLEKQRHTDN